jgi:hypothetical protein
MAKIMTLEVIVKVEDEMWDSQAENYVFAGVQSAIDEMQKDTYHAELLECELLSERQVPNEG